MPSPFPSWLGELHDDLQRLASQDLLRRMEPAQPLGRTLCRAGQTLVNLAGNDYLALAQHPHLRQAAASAIERFGTGSCASRLIAGHQALHQQVESRFAAFKHAQAALIFPTGYMANLAVLTTLAQAGDLICLDKLNHASLIDAALASRAIVRTYPHRNLEKLQRILARTPARNTRNRTQSPPSQLQMPRPPRTFIVSDSVFSMDGDVADLPALCDLARRYDAMLIVDEAHGTGILGETGAGLCELQGVAHRVDVVISTASKALGGLGGIVTAPRVVIDTLVNRARPFIYTTAAPPGQVAAIDAALDVIRDEPWRRRRVLELAAQLRSALPQMRDDRSVSTPIIPIITGTAAGAMALAAQLRDAGFYAPAIRPPTVAPNSARVRITLRADLQDADLDRLIACLRDWRLGINTTSRPVRCPPL